MESVTPLTRCAAPGCGKLLGEHEAHKNGKRPTWQCAHTLPGDNRAPLQIWASTCNLREGSVRGHREAFGKFREAAGAAAGQKNGSAVAGGPERTENPHRRAIYGFVDAHAAFHYEPEGDVLVPPCRRRNGVNCPTCAEWHAQYEWHGNGTRPRRSTTTTTRR
jgi:hypothetical protein